VGDDADAGAEAAGADAGEGEVLTGPWLALLHARTAKTADKAGVIERRGNFLMRSFSPWGGPKSSPRKLSKVCPAIKYPAFSGTTGDGRQI